MMCPLKMWYTMPCLGLVLMSVHVCPVGQCLMVTSPWLTLSLIKKLHLNMFSALQAAGSAICLEQHCAHVVLVKEQRLYVETLFLHEVGSAPRGCIPVSHLLQPILPWWNSLCLFFVSINSSGPYLASSSSLLLYVLCNRCGPRTLHPPTI